MGGVERDRRQPGRGVVVRLVRLHRIRERLVGVRHDADIAMEQVGRGLVGQALAQEVDVRIGGHEFEQLRRRSHSDEHDLDSGGGQRAHRLHVEAHRQRSDVHRPRAGNRGELGRLGQRVDCGIVPVVVDAVADIGGVRHVVDRALGQSAHDIARGDQLPADVLEDRLVGSHHVPLGELVVGHEHGPRAHRRELVVQPPVRLRDPEIEQHRVVQLSQLDDAARDLVAAGGRGPGAAEHEQSAVVASAELRLTRGGEERFDVRDAAGGGGLDERVGDRVAGAAELAVVVLEPGDDDVGRAHAACWSTGGTSRSAAQRSTVTSAWATT